MTEEEHPVDKWRLTIISFLLDYWVLVHPLLLCPAKDMKHPDPAQRNERPCFGCSDLQVMACVADNGKNESRIRAYQPGRK